MMGTHSEVKRLLAKTDVDRRLSSSGWGAMGAAATKLRLLASKKRTTRLLMIGLDAAGKSTILYKLKLGEVSAVAATAGYACDTARAKKGGPFFGWPRVWLSPVVVGSCEGLHVVGERALLAFFFKKKPSLVPLVCDSPLRGGQVVQSIPTIGKERIGNGLLGRARGCADWSTLADTIRQASTWRQWSIGKCSRVCECRCQSHALAGVSLLSLSLVIHSDTSLPVSDRYCLKRV
jgi:hypothetical protein